MIFVKCYFCYNNRVIDVVSLKKALLTNFSFYKGDQVGMGLVLEVKISVPQ